MLRHIVMWKLKDAADAPRFKAQLDSCQRLVPGMLTFEVAIRTAGLEANCDVVLYSVFDSREALATYQNHPHHQQVSQLLGALRETRSVLDYEIQSTPKENS
ncbi:MAG: Stress responsive alpha-beta barrel [Polaromonas sp.]|nr:Stress responsive alpha-beta barrel [Polaromonas sp.]